MAERRSQKHSKAVKSQFPLLLVLKITDYFPEEADPWWSRNVTYSRAMIPLLYRAPRITSGEGAQKLCTSLCSRKQLREIVRVLNWTVTKARYDLFNSEHAKLQKYMPNLCPNLEQIIVTNFFPTASDFVHRYYLGNILECRRQLKRITVNNFGPLTDKLILEIPSRFTLLQILELPGTPIELHTALALIRGCHHLTELVLQNAYEPEEMADIERARPPHLTIRYSPS
ncbi:hypothetical protein DFS34DRAFT_317887 [Phlyctochytrium arcticum]|nr:hypothetical protein DFS34DRAFT_317887 [Phlyctochytrium arcticum]